jgi:transposase-like protein
MRNVLNHFPKRRQKEVKVVLQEMYYTSTKEQALGLMDRFARRYHEEYPRAVGCLLKDREALLTYYSYPRDHWPSLKTTNPIESIFASVKLRTNAARRIKSTRSALYLIFQLIARAQKRWRRINAPQMVQKVIERIKFENGLEVKIEKKKREKAAA